MPLAAPDPSGVPATAWWVLYLRAAEARHPRSLLPDPLAADVLARSGWPARETFGPPVPPLAQYLAARSRVVDAEVRSFLAHAPHGTVVALGEGLETQFWRVDDGRVRWLTVDLPETLAWRRALLPRGPRQRTVACSVTDPRWADGIDPAQPLLISAQGLMMYLPWEAVARLVTLCAERFPGAALVFDTVPHWVAVLARRQMLYCGTYRLPPLSSSMSPGAYERLRTLHPRIAGVRRLPWPPCRGLTGLVLHHGQRSLLVRRALPGVVRLDFRQP
ncbi:class I SAM-dependent methyltransferase [Streptomyces sp. SCA3-4]|uniref:class I SAM-dependent methyltransferase n=1 Tax=Streptomyces sichuanensis TaxID=2871810 RepID=UPI001CE32F9F|nr:class I SAM-dependent methyltransferase [Streptomyces sichuanensis]MCA6093832.1 class I SAM-dependent methyltransferase [Streptomyces sichuanensis]